MVKVIRTTALPRAGSHEEVVLVGKEMFFSSRGHFDRPAGTTVSTDERLSSEGWQNCASCHFEGLTDGDRLVVPRRPAQVGAAQRHLQPAATPTTAGP